MTTTLTAASLPVFKQALANLAHILKKAQANAVARNMSPDEFLAERSVPDMLPFAAQVRIACDAAKNGTARVGAIDAPRFPDDETTFAELQERIAKTLAWLEAVPNDAFDGRVRQEVSFPWGKDTLRTMRSDDYLKHMVIPNMHFHVVMAYALLRKSGVDLGKADYLVGALSMATKGNR